LPIASLHEADGRLKATLCTLQQMFVRLTNAFHSVKRRD